MSRRSGEVPAKAALATRIKDAMSARGVSQERLGAEIGMTQTAVSRIVRGDRKVAAHEIEKIAKALDVETSYLLTGEGAPPAPSSANKAPSASPSNTEPSTLLALPEYLEADRDDLTARERRFLEGFRTRTEEAGELRLTRHGWRALVAQLREHFSDLP